MFSKLRRRSSSSAKQSNQIFLNNIFTDLRKCPITLGLTALAIATRSYLTFMNSLKQIIQNVGEKQRTMLPTK